MPKKLDGLSKEQLRNLECQIMEEIKQLKNVIEASNTPVFDLLVREVKKEMQDNIMEEEWKKLKENQKKIESYRSIEKTLQNQEELLERKEEELEEIQKAIKFYQPTLFEKNETTKEAINTGFKDKKELPIKTGDIYISDEASNTEDDFPCYFIKESSQIDGCFAIISNAFMDELLLQYPKNLELINNAHFEGNIYIDDKYREKALELLKKIEQTQEKQSDETDNK